MCPHVGSGVGSCEGSRVGVGAGSHMIGKTCEWVVVRAVMWAVVWADMWVLPELWAAVRAVVIWVQ